MKNDSNISDRLPAAECKVHKKLIHFTLPFRKCLCFLTVDVSQFYNNNNCSLWWQVMHITKAVCLAPRSNRFSLPRYTILDFELFDVCTTRYIYCLLFLRYYLSNFKYRRSGKCKPDKTFDS